MRRISKSKGSGCIVSRVADKHSHTVDFMLSEHRYKDAATTFFKQSINQNGFPDKVVMDKSGANFAGLANVNQLVVLAGFATLINICQIKYPNNITEKDHRFIKKTTKPVVRFKAFYPAEATISGTETAHMIRKWHLLEENIPAHKQFMALAA